MEVNCLDRKGGTEREPALRVPRVTIYISVVVHIFDDRHGLLIKSTEVCPPMFHSPVPHNLGVSFIHPYIGALDLFSATEEATSEAYNTD